MGRSLLEAVLKRFTEADGFLSGETISERLGCSRVAVWKQIETLRRHGYQFEAKTRKGYRLIHRPDTVIPEEIKCFNRAGSVGQTIRYVESTATTQRIAHDWAQEGAVHGSLVIADEQTGGKGRMGRTWHSPKGTGLWMSFILRPEIPLNHAPHLTLLLSVAVARALRRESGADVGIKWPNDLYVGGKKVCGVLTEVRAEADRVHYCVAGVGINIHPYAGERPYNLDAVATSLAEHSVRPLHRAKVAGACCLEIEQLLKLYEQKGFSPIRTLWESYAFMLGQTVTVRAADGTKTGIAVSLDENGALLLKTGTGTERVYSADVSYD